jgi:hypothetical protein
MVRRFSRSFRPRALGKNHGTEGDGVAEDGTPIAYTALEKGVPVVSQSGHEFGTVERVLADPAVGIFHGLVVATAAGLRVVDRDHVERITTARVTCALTDEEAAALPLASEHPGPGQQPRKPWFEPRGLGAGVVIVRCSRGGLFEELWIPLASFKAIRLGPFRIERCPVHDRVEIVQQVDPSTLSDAERAQAARYPAGRIP